jgi:ABC-type branched-subunit amino acid transport system substrate-binding protein
VFGVSVPLSGQTAAFGLSAKTSFENVTVPNFNKNYPNGILGHHVKFEILDDASDVTKAVQVANQLVADKVTAVVTVSYNPAGANQQLAVLTKNKVPYLGSRPETEYADTSKYPYIFNIGPSTKTGAAALAKWVGKHTEIRKIAALADGLPATEESWNAFTADLKTTVPDAVVTKRVNFPPGATDVSAAIAELKATNPDLLYVGASFAYGPIWQAIQAANWSPRIYVGAGAWYDSFKAMGPLADKAVTTYSHCVAKGRAPLPVAVTQAMDGYADLLGTNTTNYLTYSGTDDVPVLLVKAAIEKYKSTSPDAIKRALEEMKNFKVLDIYQFTYSPTDHDGLTGELATNICGMSESTYAFGKYRIPTIAD